MRLAIANKKRFVLVILILAVLFFIVWLLMNTGKISGIVPFDPFPFPLMTTMVSLEAIILTLIVLMSQNRQSFISSLREEIDMQVNIVAEKEITKILRCAPDFTIHSLRPT